MQEEVVVVQLTISTGFVGAEHEKEVFFNRAEWNAADKETRDTMIREELEMFRDEEIGTEAKVIEGAEPDDNYTYGEY